MHLLPSWTLFQHFKKSGSGKPTSHQKPFQNKTVPAPGKPKVTAPRKVQGPYMLRQLQNQYPAAISGSELLRSCQPAQLPTSRGDQQTCLQPQGHSVAQSQSAPTVCPGAGADAQLPPSIQAPPAPPPAASLGPVGASEQVAIARCKTTRTAWPVKLCKTI